MEQILNEPENGEKNPEEITIEETKNMNCRLINRKAPGPDLMLLISDCKTGYILDFIIYSGATSKITET